MLKKTMIKYKNILENNSVDLDCVIVVIPSKEI